MARHTQELDKKLEEINRLVETTKASETTIEELKGVLIQSRHTLESESRKSDKALQDAKKKIEDMEDELRKVNFTNNKLKWAKNSQREDFEKKLEEETKRLNI